MNDNISRSGPSRQIVYTNISDSIYFSVEWIKLIQINQKLPYRILDIGNISLIIKECIDELAKRNESLRWFWTSTRYGIIAAVRKKIQEY